MHPPNTSPNGDGGLLVHPCIYTIIPIQNPKLYPFIPYTDQSMLRRLKSPSIRMLGKGEGKDIIQDLVFRIMSLNSVIGQVGGRYIRMIISDG